MIRAGKGPLPSAWQPPLFRGRLGRPAGRRSACGRAVTGIGWSRGALVTGSLHVNTYRVPLSGAGAVYFKRYVYTIVKNRYFLQQSRAANEVYSYQQLAAIGIPTLKPLALGEIREFGRLIAACIVTRGSPGCAQPG